MPCSDLAATNSEQCRLCGHKAPQISTLLNLLLAIFLGFVGYVSGSKAVDGNAIYAFKDFVTSLVVVIGIKVSEKPADEQHPYGYGKVEFVAMLFIGIAIFIASMFLLVNSVQEIWDGFSGELPVPKLFALSAGCISVIANYKLYRYLQCVGTKRNSPAILATAKHHHSDTISSLFVVLAIIGANIGLRFLDPLVAVIETVDLMRLSLGMLQDALNGVMDGSMHTAVRSEAEATALLVPGVRRVSHVTVRQFGQNRWIDLTIKVDGDKPSSEGYLIGEHVKGSIVKAVQNIANVSVSIEPYMP